MTSLSKRAERQLRALARFYARKERPEAIVNFAGALAEALTRIQHDPTAGMPAPRPYPQLRRNGYAWVKCGAYWFSYRLRAPRAITSIFYERADIPRRA